MKVSQSERNRTAKRRQRIRAEEGQRAARTLLNILRQQQADVRCYIASGEHDPAALQSCLVSDEVISTVARDLL